MIKATVKWYSLQKGYGFALVDGRDVFIHYIAIQGDGMKELNEGENVDMEIIEGPKGAQATKVARS